MSKLKKLKGQIKISGLALPHLADVFQELSFGVDEAITEIRDEYNSTFAAIVNGGGFYINFNGKVLHMKAVPTDGKNVPKDAKTFFINQ